MFCSYILQQAFICQGSCLSLLLRRFWLISINFKLLRGILVSYCVDIKPIQRLVQPLLNLSLTEVKGNTRNLPRRKKSYTIIRKAVPSSLALLVFKKIEEVTKPIIGTKGHFEENNGSSCSAHLAVHSKLCKCVPLLISKSGLLILELPKTYLNMNTYSLI